MSVLARSILVVALTFGALVMYADHRSLVSNSTIASSPDPGQFSNHPFGKTYALPAAARQAGQVWGSDPENTIELIYQALDQYPLNTRSWLDLARIEAGLHGRWSQALGAHLEAAVGVRPRSRWTRWQALQIALQAGDMALSETHLVAWLRKDPRDTHRALFIAGRWIDNPDELLNRIIPDDNEFLAPAMSFALRQGDVALAEAIWDRVEDRVDLADPTFLAYVEFLFEHGSHERAVALWAKHDRYYQPRNIANGDFSRPLGAPQGLNWQTGRLPEGVRINRDHDEYYYRPASLKIKFSGDHNLRLRAPWIRIPVEPGRRYQLSGYWRADGLTTRSLPFWSISAENANMSQRVDVPNSRFDWTAWSVTFDVPETSRMIRLRLQRESTSAFDRYIDGQLWLDGITLTELDVAEPAPDV